MKHCKRMIPVAVCTGMLLLTGCAKETDLSARYPDFMKYSFGEDYQTELRKDGEGKNADKWTFRYQDSTGASRACSDYSIFPYDLRSKSFTEWSEEEYYSLRLWQLASLEISHRSDEEMTEQMIKPHFPEYNGDNNADGNLGSAKLFFGAMPVLDFTMDSFRDDYAILQTYVTPGTGWQVCTADWKTVANSPDWLYIVSVDADEDADAAAYAEKLRDTLRDYKEKAGAAQNYSFFVRLVKDGKPEIFWEENAILGAVTETARYSQDAADALRNKINGR